MMNRHFVFPDITVPVWRWCNTVFMLLFSRFRQTISYTRFKGSCYAVSVHMPYICEKRSSQASISGSLLGAFYCIPTSDLLEARHLTKEGTTHYY
jgi:hypothetical protein